MRERRASFARISGSKISSDSIVTQYRNQAYPTTFYTVGSALVPPAITSANNSTFLIGTSGSFTVTVTGSPTPTLSESGTLPSGISFNTSTGVLSGTAASGTNGTYPITFTANNGNNTAQNFTLTVDTAGTVFYYLEDSLGTARVITTATGTVCYDADFYPFGGERAYTDTCDPAYKFTGKERDSESGLDNFGARYDSSQYGRFMTPDQSMAFSIRQINPQRWNQYAYSINNPLSYTDPTGNDAIAVNFSGMVAGLGHEGIISVHSDGSSSYARFGPTDHGIGNTFGAYGRGEVQQSSDLPKLQFNGLAPTQESLKALIKSVAGIEGVDPSTVKINYFKTSEADTIMMDNALTQTAQAAATGSGPFCVYSVATNNCGTFTLAGLLWGNAITSAQSKSLSLAQSTDPNALFGGLQGFSFFNIDFSQIENPPACVSTDDGLGNQSTSCD